MWRSHGRSSLSHWRAKFYGQAEKGEVTCVWAFLFSKAAKDTYYSFTPNAILSYWGTIGRLGELILIFENLIKWKFHAMGPLTQQGESLVLPTLTDLVSLCFPLRGSECHKITPRPQFWIPQLQTTGRASGCCSLNTFNVYWILLRQPTANKGQWPSKTASLLKNLTEVVVCNGFS